MIFEGQVNVQKRKNKLKKILEKQHPALMLGGLMGTDMRIAKAAYNGGCRIFEPNHPAMALQMGLYGATTMNEAEQIRHYVPLERMTVAVRGIRSVLSDDVFVTCGARGTFTEEQPITFSLDDALNLALAGADCIHSHKSSIEDVAQMAATAHKAGLLCEAYISHSDTFGVNAYNDELLVRAIHDYEDAGVDLLGLCTGMIYQGKNATGFNDECMHRIDIFLRETSVIKVLEGGIKQGNISEVKKLGFDILVMSTAIDHVIEDATKATVFGLLK